MSEVNRYRMGPYTCTATCNTGGTIGSSWVSAEDFDAEHAIRLDAERQVGELREELAKEEAYSEEADEMLDQFGEEVKDLRAQLDTAIDLLRVLSGENFTIEQFKRAIDESEAFLGTTSTEGKDEYCGDHCTAFDQIEDFTEGKDHG